MLIEIYNTDLRESSLMSPNHRYHHCPYQVIIIVSHLPIIENDLYHQSSPSQVIIIVSHLPTIETPLSSINKDTILASLKSCHSPSLPFDYPSLCLVQLRMAKTKIVVATSFSLAIKETQVAIWIHSIGKLRQSERDHGLEEEKGLGI